MTKRRKIDYYNKNLSNPFFRRKKRNIKIPSRYFSWKNKLTAIGIFILLICLFWLTFFSSVFKIRKIEINGLIRIASTEVANSIWQQTKTRKYLIFPQVNLLAFSKKNLRNRLNDQYTFTEIIIKKHLPNTLILNIQEKSYAYIFCEAEKYYYADIDGHIINEINPLEIRGKKYPLIANNGSGKIIDNKINIDIGQLDFILNIFSDLKDNSYNLAIEKFIIDKELNTIKIKLINGPKIYFNTEEGIDRQINKLLVIKNEKLKDDFNAKEYIDLRYGDRVYYR